MLGLCLCEGVLALREGGLRRAFKSAGVFLAGMVVPILLWVIYFAVNGALGDAVTAYLTNNIFLYGDGALTLAEIAAVGRASVLIPSPNVAENHQYHNAMQLQKLGAAVVVEEKELTGEKLIGIVDKLTKDPAELMLMGAKARALAQPDSLDKICENLDRLMKTTA